MTDPLFDPPATPQVTAATESETARGLPIEAYVTVFGSKRVIPVSADLATRTVLPLINH